MLDARLRDHPLQGRREVLEDDDGLGAGVLELMLEFARRVERVHVDGDESRPQHGGDRHRILQHVRHHDRDARAALQTASLQPRAERRRQRIDLAEGQGLVHADIGLLVAMPGEALLEQRHHAGIGRRIYVRRHARRITLEPKPVHVVSLPEPLQASEAARSQADGATSGSVRSRYDFFSTEVRISSYDSFIRSWTILKASVLDFWTSSAMSLVLAIAASMAFFANSACLAITS